MPTQNKPTLSGGKRQWVRSKKRTLSAGAVLVLCLEKSPKFALSMAEIIYLTKRHLSAESLSFPLEVNSFLEAAEGLVKTKTILRLTIPGRADLFTLKKALRYYRQQ